MSSISGVLVLMEGAATNLKLAANELNSIGDRELAIHATELNHAAFQVQGWAGNLANYNSQDDLDKVRKLVKDNMKLIDISNEEEK